jgi:hypothetical protein
MNLTEKIHGSYIHNRRTEVLAAWMCCITPTTPMCCCAKPGESPGETC